jgi:hypothetical protein
MRVSRTQATEFEEHFQVELNTWSDDLTVEVGWHGVVSHAGSAVPQLLADNTGLTRREDVPSSVDCSWARSGTR